MHQWIAQWVQHHLDISEQTLIPIVYEIWIYPTATKKVYHHSDMREYQMNLRIIATYVLSDYTDLVFIITCWTKPSALCVLN